MPYVEAFINEKQHAWITAHVHMYNYFGGIARILVPYNWKTAVVHRNDWYTPNLLLRIMKWLSIMVLPLFLPELENQKINFKKLLYSILIESPQ